tara:strand:+ start:299 stop:931 length:633 start_codon:yes stop_codon:yes gene_type:complete
MVVLIGTKYIVLSILIIFLFLLLFGAAWILAPKFLENYGYAILIKQDEYEVRKYSSANIATVYIKGTQETALRQGFKELNHYFSAKDREGKKISMTVPVMQRKLNENQDWSIHFVLPKKLLSSKIPNPQSKKIEIKESGLRLAASITFSGRPTEKRLREKKKKLNRWVQSRGLTVTEIPIYAYYNDPLTPSFFLRNEIIFGISTPKEHYP